MSELRRAIAASSLAPLQRGEDGSAAERFRFCADFPGFAGHFPGYPILPAVVQVLTAQTVAERLSGGPFRLSAVERARFLVQLRPGQEIEVRCRRRKTGSRTVWEATLETAGQLAASFWMVPAGEEGA